MGFFEDFLESALYGLAGQRSPKAEFRSQAKSMGLTPDQLSEQLKREQEIKERKALEELLRLQLENDAKARAEKEANAGITAKTGLRQGEELEALTQFISPDSPDKAQTFQGDTQDVFQDLLSKQGSLPAGLFLGHPSQTREEVAAATDQRLQQEALEREIAKERFDRSSELFDRGIDTQNVQLRAAEHDLDERRLELDRTKEQRIQRFTGLNMELMNERLQKLRDRNVPTLSDGQAMQLAVQLFGADVEPEEADAGLDLSRKARLIKEYYENPQGGVARMREAIQDSIERAESSFEDSLIGQQGASGFSREVSEGDNLQQPQETPPPAPALPARQGVPDPRAMDPGVSLMELVGADPEMQKLIQQSEIEGDQQRLEMQVRHLISLGVPEEEWPEDLKQFVETLRNPEALQSLGGVQ